MSIRSAVVAASAILLVAGACSSDNDGSDADSSSSPPTVEASESVAPSASETPSATSRTEVESDDSALGVILTDAKGNTLYAFLPDDRGPSTCLDDCAASWPPFMAKGELEVSGNDEDLTDADLLGEVSRDDGGSQVTYNGWPLYHFSGDEAPGDTNGQGLSDVWYVVSPKGTLITS